MKFYRTVNGRVLIIGDVTNLGFNSNEKLVIPDEYLDIGEFIILRTCFGIGDWGIISAFPRKLKEKYPDCKVWIPSPKLLKNMFGGSEQNWSSWGDPFNVVHSIFDNNPYIDGYIDDFTGDVFNDHYRVYDTCDGDVPLLEQMLKFWQFDDIDNIEPEMYWSKSEMDEGDNIIKQYSDGKFGTLLIPNGYKFDADELIQQKLDEYDLPIFYWVCEQNRNFKYNGVLDLRHIDIRVQLYIKSKAVFNVGSQCGVNDTIANYTSTFSVAKNKLKSNIIKSQNYMYRKSISNI